METEHCMKTERKFGELRPRALGTRKSEKTTNSSKRIVTKRNFDNLTIIFLDGTRHNQQLGNQTPLHATDIRGPHTTFLEARS